MDWVEAYFGFTALVFVYLVFASIRKVDFVVPRCGARAVWSVMRVYAFHIVGGDMGAIIQIQVCFCLAGFHFVSRSLVFY